MRKNGKLISEDEWFVVGAILSLSLILIVILPFLMNSSWFTKLIPPIQYILYNLGFLFLTIVLLGIPLSFALHERMNLFHAVKGGIGSWLIFSFVLDLWQPPFAIGPSGTLFITDTSSLIGTSVDYMLLWVFTHLFPNELLLGQTFGGVSLVFVLIYFVTPFVAVVGAALLMKPGILLNLFRREVL